MNKQKLAIIGLALLHVVGIGIGIMEINLDKVNFGAIRVGVNGALLLFDWFMYSGRPDIRPSLIFASVTLTFVGSELEKWYHGIVELLR